MIGDIDTDCKFGLEFNLWLEWSSCVLNGIICTNPGVVDAGVREPAVGAGAHVRHPALAVRGPGGALPRARRNPRHLTDIRL